MENHKNLIEDEKEARKDRLYMKVAIASLFVGLLFFWMKYGNKIKRT
jgi:hypothetical protein